MTPDKKQKGPPPRYIERLVASEYNLTEPGWYKLNLAADVKRGKFPDPLARVQFFVDEEPYQSAKATDRNGRATLPSEIAAGTHTIGALIIGEPINKMVTTKIFLGEVPEKKEESTKRAVQLNVIPHYQGNGLYHLTFEALDENGMRVPGAPIEIQEWGQVCVLYADQNGSAYKDFQAEWNKPNQLQLSVLGHPVKSFSYTLYAQKDQDPATKHLIAIVAFEEVGYAGCS